MGRALATGEDRAAASVAALVGGVKPSTVLRLAQDSFTSLPWAALSYEHIASNSDSGLNQFTNPTKLGECDAFLSHSWHESFYSGLEPQQFSQSHSEHRPYARKMARVLASSDAEKKWSSLVGWAEDFASRHNREPSCWLVSCLNTAHNPCP